MNCTSNKLKCQPYPEHGPLLQNLDIPLNKLAQIIDSPQSLQTIYCYVIATVENHNGRFVQKGSGPNFQGGFITLCTCKHYMRSGSVSKEWIGKWIAGFSTLNAGAGKNTLVFLMRIGHAFESHKGLWASCHISQQTKDAKNASFNRLGDIFQPTPNFHDCYDPQSYHYPIPGHVHDFLNQKTIQPVWHQDIDYKGYGRRPSLLVGDPKLSFLWSEPKIYLDEEPHLTQGCEKYQLNCFFERLK